MKSKQDILTFEWEWENYPLEEYNSPRSYFDNVGKVKNLVGKDFYHEDAIEDNSMNATNYYDVCIKDYCRMSFNLAEKNLHLTIPDEIRIQDSKKLLDPYSMQIKLVRDPV